MGKFRILKNEAIMRLNGVQRNIRDTELAHNRAITFVLVLLLVCDLIEIIK